MPFDQIPWQAISQTIAWGSLVAIFGRWLLKRTPSADKADDIALKDREISTGVTERTIGRMEEQIRGLQKHRDECDEKLNSTTLRLAEAQIDIKWLKETASGRFLQGVAATHQSIRAESDK